MILLPLGLLASAKKPALAGSSRPGGTKPAQHRDSGAFEIVDVPLVRSDS